MNAAKVPSTEPVVGTQPRGSMSTSMKAFTKREAASFSPLNPSAAGYCEQMPESRAFFSASTP